MTRQTYLLAGLLLLWSAGDALRADPNVLRKRIIDEIADSRRHTLARSEVLRDRRFVKELEESEVLTFGKILEESETDDTITFVIEMDGNPNVVWQRVVMALKNMGWRERRNRLDGTAKNTGIRMSLLARNEEQVNVVLAGVGNGFTSRVFLRYERLKGGH